MFANYSSNGIIRFPQNDSNPIEEDEYEINDDNDRINESNISDDDAVTTTIIPVDDSETTEANENMTASDAKDSETSEDPEPATVANNTPDWSSDKPLNKI